MKFFSVFARKIFDWRLRKENVVDGEGKKTLCNGVFISLIEFTMENYKLIYEKKMLSRW